MLRYIYVKYVTFIKYSVTFSRGISGIFITIKVLHSRNSDKMETKPIGFWNTKKDKLRLKYPFLREEDLEFHTGKEKEMMELPGYKMGMSKQALIQIIETI